MPLDLEFDTGISTDSGKEGTDAFGSVVSDSLIENGADFRFCGSAMFESACLEGSVCFWRKVADSNCTHIPPPDIDLDK